jgi:hypothetical protein
MIAPKFDGHIMITGILRCTTATGSAESLLLEGAGPRLGLEPVNRRRAATGGGAGFQLAGTANWSVGPAADPSDVDGIQEAGTSRRGTQSA